MLVKIIIGLALGIIVSCQSLAENENKQSANTQNKATADQRGTEQLPFVVEARPPKRTEAQAAQEDRDKADHSQNETWLMRATVMLAIVTAILAFFTYQLWTSTKNLVERTDRTARTHERAYLFCGLQPTGNPHAVMNCRNDGRTLAFIKPVQWGLCEEAKFPKTVAVSRLIDEESFTFATIVRIQCEELLPSDGAQISIWPVQIECANNTGKIFFGRVCYEDVFKDAHYATFKFRLAVLEPAGTKTEALEGCYSDWA